MNLTQEQCDIINTTGDIRINAVAGSGKTTTIIEYARTRPRSSRILYLAFNRSVKMEAVRRFADDGIGNVKVETAHSLAFKRIIFNTGYKVRNQGYMSHEIAELMEPHFNAGKHVRYIIANHINKFIAYYCNSEKQKVQELNYLDIVSDNRVKSFLSPFYEFIERQTRLILNKMDKREIEVTHDFYLKKFQLSNPVLDFDYILFDEGQDASPAMLDIFLRQKAVKVIVGDTHQQIYGWRFAVNSLEKVNFKNCYLTTSFRFSQEIADLAMEVLKFKSHIMEYKPVSITGKGISRELRCKAVLARTNLGLLSEAIECVTRNKKIKWIYFEGNISSYTYADEGASLYDVLNLYNGKKWLIKDKLIKEMNKIDELVDYVEKTEDVQLGMMIEIVRQYGNEIPNILARIKSMHVGSDEKEKADMIFSTVHRCKGMEYDSVRIVNDFISEEKLKGIINIRYNDKEIDFSKLNEEINLLYVAITRSKNIVYIPDELMPEQFPCLEHVRIIGDQYGKNVNNISVKLKSLTGNQGADEGTKAKVYSADFMRERIRNAHNPWTPEMEEELISMLEQGRKIKTIVNRLGRTKGSIMNRIKKIRSERFDYD